MKVVISGHSKGIGHATFDMLRKKNINVIGMSRASGHDLRMLRRIKLSF